MSTVEKGALPRQDSTGWRIMTGRPLGSPGALEGDTLDQGYTKEREHSQPLLEAVSTTQTSQVGACLGGGVAGVGEDDRQAAREKAHVPMHA